MSSVLKRSAVAMLTASVLAASATAQEATPDSPDPTLAPPITTAPASPPTRKPTKPRTAVFAEDQLSQPIVLPAVPPVPSSWAIDASKLATDRQTPTTIVPASFPQSTQAAAPTAAVAKVPQAKPAQSGTHWPAAFVEHETRRTTDIRAASLEDNGVASAPGPIVPAFLEQKVTRLCGGLAREVKVVARGDHGVTIRVQAVNQKAEGELIDMLMKLPEMAVPNVHLEVDATP